MNRIKLTILLAILAAACYGVSAPVSKFLLSELQPTFMAALLYLGAGFGMAIVTCSRAERRKSKRKRG